MRVFFAVSLAPEVREGLAALASSLETRAPDSPVAWVPAANHHLTLRFLGDVSEEQRAALESAGREVAASQPRFRLVLEGVGTFGGKSPRVIWVGARSDAGLEALRAVHAALETRVRALGFDPDDHPVYSPHATLGRIRDERGPRRPARAKGKPRPGQGGTDALVKAIGEARFGPVEVPVERFVLYESRLHGSRHPDYVEAASFPLSLPSS